MNIDEDGMESMHECIDGLEAEKHHLSRQVEQLENALSKEKKFHRKFVDDVVQSEEIRMKDYENQLKEVEGDKKRLFAENRRLEKDKSFYETAYKALLEEDETDTVKIPPKNESKSTSASNSSYRTRHSSPISQQPLSSTKKNSVSSPSLIQKKSSKLLAKASEKFFEDNKKLKLKITKLTKDNAALRTRVNQLENYKTKIQNKQTQQKADRNELETLFESTRRTNDQIFDAKSLYELGQLSMP